jgi:4-aminobutyrate aminotransferase-like enzyme
VVPDIVTLGKPMGNGHPISAVVASREILQPFNEARRYFNTFAGNPVSAAAATAVLDVIEEEALVEHAGRTGEYLLDGLRRLAGAHPLIGDVRGRGLFLGVELVTDSATRAPATAAARRVINGLCDRGVLVGETGRHENVLKIRPPLPFAREHADLLLAALDECLAEAEGNT